MILYPLLIDIGNICTGVGHPGSTTSPPGISSATAADSCMLAIDYAQNKVRYQK